MPEENFELKDEIHEFLLPLLIGFGALLGIAAGDSDDFESGAFSALFAFVSGRGSPFLEGSLDSASKSRAPIFGGVSDFVFSARG